MNWLAFAIVSWVAVGLEFGLQPALQVEGFRSVPSFIFVLVIFLALHAPATTALWAGMLLGVIMDLLARKAEGTPVVGPYALAFVLAAQMILAFRGLINKRNPLSYAFLGLVGSLVVHAVVVGFFQLRAFYDAPAGWSGLAELKARAGSAVYTAIIALPVSLVLLRLTGFFGFSSAEKRRFARRM